ncbi:MAG: hypothetical protein ACHQ9S_14035 [Candidatus Binatia bacterium]
MRGQHGRGLVERLRRVVLGDYAQTTLQLKHEIEELRRTLDDSATLRARLVEGLHEEAQTAPERLAAALMPVVDQLLRQRTASPSQPSTRHYWPWLSALTAAGVAAVVLMNWHGPAAVVSAATEQAPASAVEYAAAPLPPILEEQAAGFGLGQASVRDEELAREVRARLSVCEQLMGARVLFSVKDGWVWLRGGVSAGGRDAADRALADLGEGVVLVNQLTVSDSTAMADH